jgi:hypothetical protein
MPTYHTLGSALEREDPRRREIHKRFPAHLDTRKDVNSADQYGKTRSRQYLLTDSCQMEAVVILEVIASPIGALVVKLDVDHVMCILIRNIDDSDHVESYIIPSSAYETPRPKPAKQRT